MTFSTTSFMTNVYGLTVVDAAITSSTAERKRIFETFRRRPPGERRYGVVCGTGCVLEAIRDFHFNPEEVEYLVSRAIVSNHTAQRLANYRFTGDVYGYTEGEYYFPYSPALTVIGLLAECAVLETVVLPILSHDSTAATTISRMTVITHDRPYLEFGTRRTHETAAVHTAHATAIAGSTATSDLEGRHTYDLGIVRTSAHSFTLVHDSEKEVLAAQIVAMGTGVTLLVDTYDIAKGVNNTVATIRGADGKLGTIRSDSGGLVAQTFIVRKQLNDLGATSTKITVTSDLDEYSIATFDAALVDSYGIGVRIMTGSGHPTAEMVYRLVQREDADGKVYEVAKSSKNKASVGRLRATGRVCNQRGNAAQEPVVPAGSWWEGLDYLERAGVHPLQIKLVDTGATDESWIRKATIVTAVARHGEFRAELPYDGQCLSSDEPVVPTRMPDIFEGDD